MNEIVKEVMEEMAALDITDVCLEIGKAKMTGKRNRDARAECLATLKQEILIYKKDKVDREQKSVFGYRQPVDDSIDSMWDDLVLKLKEMMCFTIELVLNAKNAKVRLFN